MNSKEFLEKHDKMVINKTVNKCKEIVARCYKDYIYTLPNDMTQEQAEELILRPYNYIFRELERYRKGYR